MRNLKLIIKKFEQLQHFETEKWPELGSSLRNQTKIELEIFVVTHTNISPSFILILRRIQDKQ